MRETSAMMKTLKSNCAHFAITEANLSLMKLQMFSKYYMKTKVRNVEELFDHLEPFYFLDYALLEKIVKFFLPRAHELADDLLVYLQQLANFCNFHNYDAVTVSITSIRNKFFWVVKLSSNFEMV